MATKTTCDGCGAIEKRQKPFRRLAFGAFAVGRQPGFGGVCASYEPAIGVGFSPEHLDLCQACQAVLAKAWKPAKALIQTAGGAGR